MDICLRSSGALLQARRDLHLLKASLSSFYPNSLFGPLITNVPTGENPEHTVSTFPHTVLCGSIPGSARKKKKPLEVKEGSNRHSMLTRARVSFQ